LLAAASWVTVKKARYNVPSGSFASAFPRHRHLESESDAGRAATVLHPAAGSRNTPGRDAQDRNAHVELVLVQPSQNLIAAQGEQLEAQTWMPLGEQGCQLPK